MNFSRIAAFCALSLTLLSCAGTQHVAPRFVQPSTVPIQKAQAAAVSHVQKAKEIVRTLTLSDPADKAKVDALAQELDATQEALAQSEGARAALDTQLQSQTKQANQLASDYDSQAVQITALKESRHKYVKLAWLFGSILGLELLAAGAFLAAKFGLISI